MYKCTICDKEFNSIKKRDSHFRLVHIKKICLKCGLDFNSVNYNKHTASCKGIKKKNYVDRNYSKIDSNLYQCNYCSKTYSKHGISMHMWATHGEGKNFRPLLNRDNTKKHPAWNKGLTKETSDIVKRLGEKVSITLKGRKGHKCSEEHRKFLSNTMKERHKNGLAHNIGECRWMCLPSYPEEFFMRVIENEFYDRNYRYEYVVGRYSIDFAWVNIKKAIEIDGEQHEDTVYKERDQRKDRFLESEGWTILRIKWKDMCNDTQAWISIAYNFIHF